MKEIQLLISGTSIEDLDINRLINRIIYNKNDSEEKKKVTKWFLEILNDETGKDFPFNKNEEKHNVIKLRKIFISNLIHFWTSLRSLTPQTVLTISYSDRGVYPESHTCFDELVLPINVSTKQQLYKNIRNAFILGGKGLQQMGGKNTDNLENTLMGITGLLSGLVYLI